MYCENTHQDKFEYLLGFYDEKKKKKLDRFMEKYITEIMSPNELTIRLEGDELQREIYEVIRAFCRYSSNARMGKHISQPVPNMPDSWSVNDVKSENGFYLPPFVDVNLRVTFGDLFYILLYIEEGVFHKKRYLERTVPIDVTEIEHVEGELTSFTVYFKDHTIMLFSVDKNRKAFVGYP